MSTGRQTVRDLIDEAKKRIVLLFICVIGLSYLMSLTSSSVWVNLPAAASLIFLLRYISLDIDMRKRVAAYKRKLPVDDHVLKKSIQGSKVVAHEKTNWRRKVNSPVVEAAIDQFSRHLISEWVTDLWYSRLTPDKDGPEELVQIINGVLGEISSRAREINLIDLLTRDIINLICTHLEIFRTSQAKIEKEKAGNLTIDRRDVELKLVLAAENKLHPALFSAEAEHKVLQHLMDGLISFTFRHEDLQCSFFRYIVRELLSCAVMRPVLNLATPRFINERIESLVLSINNKANKGATPTAQETSQHKPNGASRTSSGQLLGLQDRSVSGVELVQFKHENSGVSTDEAVKKNVNGSTYQKDPLLSVDTRTSHSWSSLPSDSQTVDGREIQPHQSGGEWGQMLDIISHRKTQALAPEHFENMWTKGRNYKKKEGDNRSNKQGVQNLLSGSHISDHSKVVPKYKIKDGKAHVDSSEKSTSLPPYDGKLVGEKIRLHTDGSNLTHPPVASNEEENGQSLMCLEEDELESDSSYTTEDDENSNVTGLDSPGTKVWDSKNKRNGAVPYIHHPLESSEGHAVKKSGKGHAHYKKIPRIHTGKKRSRLSSQKVQTWQEVERTSFLLGEGKDILNASKDVKAEESSDDPELESWGRVHSGSAASSSVASFLVSEAHTSSMNSLGNSVLEASFLRLRCEVLGANVVKSDSRTFAVYSISVTDADNSSWSIKRRFRHFEELHRRLKEFPEYNLSLPPKHFLSSGLDVTVVQERCKLLDRYLKKLLQLPTISGSIEVWDFLSVDSQTYMFSDCLSVVQTLSVDLDDKPYEKSAKVQHVIEPADDHLSSMAQNLGRKSKENVLQMKQNLVADDSSLKTRNTSHTSLKSSGKDRNILYEDSDSDSDGRGQNFASSIRKLGKPLKERVSDNPKETSELLLDAATDPTLPTEWMPPNLSAPILDLVDAIFQLQDGGWVRRQAFWVAKQVLQLGMGDAFDDWLIEKIQLLRRGSVIASAINRIEQQILWPDGIFLTKHPKRQRPPQSVSQSQSPHYARQSQSPHFATQSPQMSSPKRGDVQKLSGESNFLTDEQQQAEAARRSKFVYELMIDKAPAPLVSLFGRKEYEKSVKDLYFFSQSSVCLKQLAFDLLELLLLSAFPELDDVIKQLHEEKHKFGQFEVK
ncbi:Phox homologous domain [Macleaya cordata]|uniref:Phox homologous domain n=1 Tax=Macleaya cordata TaxID=56857 RepID=A0A200PP12_MACCD|nr:Phox homologous domain [Macleaya cordata]